MSKLSFHLAFAAASSFTLYGRGGKILGRTKHNKFLRKQTIVLPENGKERDEWVKQIYSACDATTMPVPYLLDEDESRPEADQIKHADINEWDDLSDLAHKGSNSDPLLMEEMRQTIKEAILNYGKLTRQQIADITEYTLPDVESAVLAESFVIDEDGNVDFIVEERVEPKKKATKKKGK